MPVLHTSRCALSHGAGCTSALCAGVKAPLGHGKQMVLLLGSCSMVLGPAQMGTWTFWGISPTSQHLSQMGHHSYFSMPQTTTIQSPLFRDGKTIGEESSPLILRSTSEVLSL